ncbi:MAG: DUF4835 domain-containing protein [Flexibacter sp. CG_4_10_14_3_um_filter_32_15]|nr:MAG: DUF4835 domain-containing protein [Flexibacter sp. CG_4_10_14_3_um_filter_32_15]
MKKYIFLVFSFLFVSSASQVLAQEFRCNVIINDSRVEAQNKQIVGQLTKALTKFMNTTQWTEDRYEEWERIECNILITLDKNTDLAQGRYSADAQIQYNRPVYGTSYTSPMLNYFDKNFDFSYKPSEPLIYIPNSTNNNLTLMLAYYSYIILALDYDSFSSLGGSPYIEKAQNIINNAQSTGVGNAGWQNNDVRSRYWLGENLNSPQFIDLRKGLYDYHRLGLDLMLEKPAEARKKTMEVLTKWKEVSAVRLNALLIQTLFDAKGEELYQLFSSAEREEKLKAAEILLQLDPAHAELYRKLQN